MSEQPKIGMNKILTRENILYQLKGIEVQLKYLRDALMHTYMDVPIKYFFELRGNLPMYVEQRMPFLEKLITADDLQFMKDIKSHIFNTNDKDLAVSYCKMDNIIWQITILSTRYAEQDKAVEHIAEVACELLQYVYFLKKEMLHLDFFPLVNGLERIKMEDLLKKVAEEKMIDTIEDNFLGWTQLEGAVEKFMTEEGAIEELENAKEPKDDPEAKAFEKAFTRGQFEVRSPLSDHKIMELYLYLTEYRISSGADAGKSVIDSDVISIEEFEQSLKTGCYDKLLGHCRMKKLYFFICHYSRAYIIDWQSYRDIAAVSLQISRNNLESYNKDPEYAKGLQKILPLFKFNNT